MNMKIISASAGSGKTYRLIEVLCEKLQRSEAHPAEVIAVTFTRNAAAELKTRVRQKLLDSAGTMEASRIEMALIGTIDSVCERLLRRFAFEAGISPDFEVLPEEYATQLFEEALAGPAVSNRQEQLWRTIERFGMEGSGQYDARSFRDDIKSIAEYARSNAMRPDQLARMAEESIASYPVCLSTAAVSNLEDFQAEQRRQFNDLVIALEPKLDTTVKYQKEYLENLRACQGNFNQNVWTWLNYVAMENNFSQPKPSQKWSQITSAIREFGQTFLQHPQFHQDVRELIRGAFDLAGLALTLYDERKRANRLIDFIDMEVKVLDLLGNEFVAKVLAEEYRLLLVDEFQDTSPVQLALYQRLGEIIGNVVWVGDKKQAIYGFRHSDPELMHAAYEAVAVAAQTEYLAQSWRSRPHLVALTSKLFGDLFVRRLNYAPQEVELTPVRPEESALGPALEFWGVELKGNANISADHIAAGVALLLQPTSQTLVFDKETKSLRPVNPGDIAILHRSNDRCDATAKALESLGISATVERTGLIWTVEGVYLLAGLEYTIQPDAALARINILNIRGDLDVAEAIVQRLQQRDHDIRPEYPIFQRLASILREKAWLSPAELLDRIIAATEVRVLCVQWGCHRTRQANIEALRNYARAYEELCRLQHQVASASGLLAYFLSLPQGGMQSMVNTAQAVNVMTYHRAKGLEWPIVVLGDLESSRESAIVCNRAWVEGPGRGFDAAKPLAGRTIRYWRAPIGKIRNSEITIIRQFQASAAEQAARQKEMQEEQSLMYVGFTRARDRLVIPFKWNKQNNQLKKLADLGLDFPVPNSRQSGEFEWRGHGLVIPARLRTLGTSEAAGASVTAPPRWLANSGRAGEDAPFVLAPSQLPPNPLTVVRGSVQIGPDYPCNLRSETDLQALGLALHGFLATDLGRSRPLAVRQTSAQNFLARHQMQDHLAIGTMLEIADRFMAYLQQAVLSGDIHCELPLLSWKDGQCTSGVADLVIETADAFWIFDHKSFCGANFDYHTKALEFAGQLQAYADILRQALGKPCRQLAIHFALAGRVVFLQ
jgi:ATP-dependent exoDNAse (exonuclease V) beta subunit